MSKGNLLQGLGSGSLGDTVFYRTGGEQMARIRNRRPYNPKTMPQMAQRTIIGNVSQAYSGMSEIVDHSIQGLQYGRQTMARFLKENIDIARYAADANLEHTSWIPKGVQDIPILPYFMSKGNLEPVSRNFDFYVDSSTLLFPRSIFNYQPIRLSNDKKHLSAEDFVNVLQLGDGSMLTLCFLVCSSRDNRDNVNPHIFSRFAFCRIKLKEGVNVKSSNLNPLDSYFLDYNNSNLAFNMADPQRPFYVKIEMVEDEGSDSFGHVKFTPVFKDDANFNWIPAFCCIRSKRVTNAHGRNVWSRSTERMILADRSRPDYTLEMSFNESMNTFTGSSVQLGSSDYYLNNSQDANQYSANY